MTYRTCAMGVLAALIAWHGPAAAADTGDDAPRPSDGCDRPAPGQAPATLTVGERERSLITVVPADYRADRPHALVIAFHGRTNSNEQVRRYYKLEGNATEPTLFVYPAGLKDASGRFTWSDPGDRAENLRDFALFDAVLDLLARTYCIDRGRVFVVGHSLGASFANSLACARGAVIRGLASVGGGIVRPRDCGGPVAAMVMHNPRDEQVPVAEGLRARDALLEQNDLSAKARPDLVNGFDCQRYGPDTAENPVLWCPHRDDTTASGRFYPHQWPDGSGVAVMEFFAGLE